MHQLNLAVAIAAGTVVLLGLVSGRAQRLPLSRPLLALLVGVAAGPAALGLLHPEAWPHHVLILKETARFALAVSVFGIALRTPMRDIRALLRPVGLLLTLGMAAMWAVSAGLAWAALGLAPLMALAVGAVVTPTDPVVASSIATGAAAEEALPSRLRSTLSLESGANDGLAYAIVLLPKLPPPDPGQMPALHSSWLPGWLGGVIHNETSNPLLIYSSDHGWATLPPGESTSGLEDWDFADHPTQGWVKVFDTQGLILRDDGVLRSGSGIHWTPGPGGWTPGTPPPTVPPYQPGL